ncbi:MFS transporter [Halopiger djelfimassiliensis]|uniref:MFS transporter n=1 Tax=Halopiger djelfimassiliensis TaxID=1293047 RepID=UPI000677E00B|nr:MFS transporter [Halopiger djelfimassiliensis]
MERLIYKYYLYKASVTFGFFWPIFTLFLLDQGLTYTQITLLNSISAALIVIGEIPTGYVADRIGRRNSMVVSSALYTGAILGFVVARTFPEFVCLWLLWSFAHTFQSGSADAWLYDLLDERLDENAYTRVRGRGASVNMWVSAATMLVSGVVYSVHPTLPFVAGGLVTAIGLPILLSMPKNVRYTDSSDGYGTDDGQGYSIAEALPIVKGHLSSPPLRSVVLYLAVFFAIVTVIDNFIQPIVVNDIGFPEASLGVIYAGFAAVAAVGSYYAETVEDVLTTGGAIVLIPPVVGVFLVVPLVIPLVALPAFFLMKTSKELLFPIMSGYINDHVGSMERATLLSTVSMVIATFRVPLQPLGGYVGDLSGPITAVAALVVAFLAFTLSLHLWEPPTEEAAESDASTTD